MIANTGVDQNGVSWCSNDITLDAEENVSRRIEVFRLQPRSIFCQYLSSQSGEKFQRIERLLLLFDNPMNRDFAKSEINCHLVLPCQNERDQSQRNNGFDPKATV